VSTLIFYMRPARRKARVAATAEALALLEDLQPTAPAGGPLSEQGGLFWIEVPASSLAAAVDRLPRLGYTEAVDVVESIDDKSNQLEASQEAGQSSGVAERVTRWRRKSHRLVRVYQEDASFLREAAVDRRTFLLEMPDGETRPVKGYRGDGGSLSRRGLPVYDARLLVNLVGAQAGTVLLDPFAGTGGIVIEAFAKGATVLSLDIDPRLRPGLAALGATHHVADACKLPFATASIDAVATEPPYDEGALPMLLLALGEMRRVLKVGGRVAVLCSATQRGMFRAESERLGLEPYLDQPINRKGLDTALCAWRKIAP
jgi:tRNA G10  N-methylase Trm11